jgi:hypothetical protein
LSFVMVPELLSELNGTNLDMDIDLDEDLVL